MSNKTKLFSEAIAEARSLKETALNNAKLSLAESFAPKIQSMISNKLNEMEDDSIEENTDVSLEEVLSELEESQIEENSEDNFESSEDDFDSETDLDSTDTNLDSEFSDEGETLGDDEVGEITVDELKDIIRDVMSEIDGGEDIDGDLDDTIGDDEFGDDESLDLAAEGYISGAGDDISGAAAGLENIVSSVKSVIAKSPEYASKIKQFIQDLGSGAGAAMRSETVEINELKKANRMLVKTLNEINLLNSKLLHVNKIFKAKNLSESQKVKIINAFDRASSVKEAENVYNTLKENLSNYTPKKQLKENLGFASKPLGNSQKPLNERTINTPNKFSVERMQKLAGL